MASGSLFAEDQFLCPICLDVFNQPVSTPCGHNFCMPCLTTYWDDAPTFQCPICKEPFQKRPHLKVNTFISELALQFMSLQVTDAHILSTNQQPGGAGVTVLCDICTDSQKEAVRSCLECLTSYCDVHLEPHHRAAGLKTHTLTVPVTSLEDKTCKEHKRLLVFFCRDDGVVLCEVCASSLHRQHNIATVLRAYDEMQDQVEVTDRKVQQMILKRLQGVEALKESVKQSKTEGEQLMTNTTQELAKIVLEIQRNQMELIRVMEEKQKEAEEQAGGLIRDMERETSKLCQTAVKLNELKQTKDRLSFLQKYQNLSLLPNTKGLSAVHSNRHMELQHMHNSISQSLRQIQVSVNNINTEIGKISNNAQSSNSSTLRLVQQYEVDVVLDPDTAHPLLVLSNDGKQVRFNAGQRLNQNLSGNMFTHHLAVLGRRGFISQKFYFEVYVGRKTEWCLGVATASIQRRGVLARSPRSGLWAIWFLEDRFENYSCPNVPVHLGKVERVGVFVDYDAGQIDFFDVTADVTICSFPDCCFEEELYPYFNPCDNEYGSNLTPMRIVPVGHME
ncbi:E3 ubiquitin-protein ligase TRIM21-like [Gouania willdenowi]|uniref:E3 ubiquitin-protein ligase TRIM21-like n=1 Tax=Gouania willdenowi TaxID=441366 RepID=A0A8C5DYT1_GOUWI|nr:E3 ubiquitin-protein ligase TRIM21-like [Gouania willdenowi]